LHQQKIAVAFGALVHWKFDFIAHIDSYILACWADSDPVGISLMN
jgi:hypothetical protein